MPKVPYRFCSGPGQLWGLLGKGGVAAPSRNIAKHPLMGADGVVGSISPQILMVREVVDRTTPSARNEVASQYLFERAATPPLPRRGVLLALNAGQHPRKPVEPSSA